MKPTSSTTRAAHTRRARIHTAGTRAIALTTAVALGAIATWASSITPAHASKNGDGEGTRAALTADANPADTGLGVPVTLNDPAATSQPLSRRNPTPPHAFLTRSSTPTPLSGSKRQAGSSMTEDCYIKAATITAGDTLTRVWVRGEYLYSGLGQARLSFAPTAITIIGHHYDPATPDVAQFTYLAGDKQGRFHILTVTETVVTDGQEVTTEVTATPLTGAIVPVRALHLAYPYVYALTSPGPGGTSRLRRWNLDTTTNSLTNLVTPGKGSWAAINSLHSTTTVTTSGGRRTSDQLRGTDTTGRLLEVRVARDTTAVTTAHRIGGKGWNAYPTVLTGTCTKAPTRLPMLAITRDGGADVFLDTKPANIPPILHHQGNYPAATLEGTLHQ